MREAMETTIVTLSISKRIAMLTFPALLALGCGGGSSPFDRQPVGPQPHQTTVSGNAVKGAVRNALVTVSPIAGGAVGEPIAATATTDVFGDFAITGTQSLSGPVLVELRAAADGTSSMVCDLPRGCGGGMGFGDVFPLEGDFKLRALIPDISGGLQGISLNIFSELAATLVLDGAGTIDGGAITAANNQVVGLFDLDGPPFRLNVRDPSGDRFPEVDADDQLASLLSVGILGSVSESPRHDIGFALEGFRQAFLNAGGQIPVAGETADDPLLSLRRILTEALAAAEDPLIRERMREEALDRLRSRAEAAGALATDE